MADKWQEYVDDPRKICKYGFKCYQKNPDHHKNFKHPPLRKKAENRAKRRFSPYTRNNKAESPTSNSNEVVDEVKNEGNAEAKIAITPPNPSTTGDKPEHFEAAYISLPEKLKYYDKHTDESIFKELFLVEMPDDFFKFYEFLGDCGKSPAEVLAGVNLELIGPYDLLMGKLPILEDKQLYLIHWRFFYDPPEFQAVLRKRKSQFHIGYFRDTPEQKSAFLASNDSAKGCQLTLMSENIFGAVYQHLEHEKKISPFTAMPCQTLIAKIKSYAEENNISLEEFTMKKRSSQIVTRTFHGAGISVPYNKNTQLGYRRLAQTDANLRKIFAKLENAKSQEDKNDILSDLQVVITNASIAVDECDFGTGLELGIDLFCSGLKDLQRAALSNLTSIYGLLQRRPYVQIVEAHMKYRRKGPNMSVISLEK